MGRACVALQRHRENLAAEADAEQALLAARRRCEQRPQAHHPGVVAEGVRRAACHHDALRAYMQCS